VKKKVVIVMGNVIAFVNVKNVIRGIPPCVPAAATVDVVRRDD